MDALRRTMVLAICVALLAACGGASPQASSGTGAPPSTILIGGASTSPSSSPVPGPIGSSGQTAAPPAGAGTIAGTIEFKSHVEEYRTDLELKTERFDVTIVVSLVRNPSDPGERYLDSGSTYQIDGLFHGERVNGNCTAITERKASSDVYAFTDQPTSYPNSIEAAVKRGSGTAQFQINVSWPYLQTVDDCPNDSSFSGENSTGLGCTGFGLEGKLVEGPTGGQIDMACTSDGALTTVAGILTLTD